MVDPSKILRDGLRAFNCSQRDSFQNDLTAQFDLTESEYHRHVIRANSRNNPHFNVFGAREVAARAMHHGGRPGVPVRLDG